MPITIVLPAFTLDLNIRPLLEKARYRCEWREWKFRINEDNYMENPPRESTRLLIVGPDAMRIATVINKEFPDLDLRVTETQRPAKPSGGIRKVLRFLAQEGEFARKW